MSDKKTVSKVHSGVTARTTSNALVSDIAKFIDEAKNHVAREYNST